MGVGWGEGGLKLRCPSRTLKPVEPSLPTEGRNPSLSCGSLPALSPARIPFVSFESYHFHHIFYWNKKKNWERFTTKKEPQNRGKEETRLLCTLTLVL